MLGQSHSKSVPVIITLKEILLTSLVIAHYFLLSVSLHLQEDIIFLINGHLTFCSRSSYKMGKTTFSLVYSVQILRFLKRIYKILNFEFIC